MNERVGRYELLERLGAGGFATVYRARDPSLDGEVAIKLLADNWSAEPDVRSRFIQEARLMRRLDNRRLVQVYDIGEHVDGRPYFVMRLATKGTLEDRLKVRWAEGVETTTDELERLVGELASCLSRVHDDDIIHRDLKPSNLLVEQEVGVDHGTATGLLSTDEFLVLADFGLARDAANGVSALTIAGGSAGFAAPEQYLPTGRPDARADLYAASAVVQYAMTGETPPVANSSGTTARLRGPWTPTLVVALQRGMSQDPADRPATVDEWRAMMSSALKPATETALTGPSPASTHTADDSRSLVAETERHARSARPATRPGARRRRRWAVALLVVVLAATATFAGFRLFAARDVPSIIGPDEIEAGESATFIVDHDESASYTWMDSTGKDGDGREFVVDAVVPGDLTVEVTAEADGDTSSNTASVRVTESPDGPVIVGPETVRVGASAVYVVDDPDAEIVEWVDASGTSTTDRFEITPTTTGSFTFSAIVVRPDGQRIGSTKVIEFVE